MMSIWLQKIEKLGDNKYEVHQVLDDNILELMLDRNIPARTVRDVRRALRGASAMVALTLLSGTDDNWETWGTELQAHLEECVEMGLEATARLKRSASSKDLSILVRSRYDMLAETKRMPEGD